MQRTQNGVLSVFSLTSISGETDGGDSPFINIPAKEEASVQKTTTKGFVLYQALTNTKDEYLKTKPGI